jgi:hypothetical protein
MLIITLSVFYAVTINSIMLNVVMQYFIMLNVVVPL